MNNYTLHLSLKKRWFDMIASGEKREEYRELSPFWIKRLIYWEQDIDWDNYIYKQMPKGQAECLAKTRELLFYGFMRGKLEFKPWLNVIFTLGYPKAGDTSKTITKYVKHIRLGLPNPDWCPEDTDLNRMVIVIELTELERLPFK